MAISSRHFDKDKANDPGTSIVSLANAESGMVQWRRTFSGSARDPVAFYSGHVLVLCNEQSTPLLELKTGDTLFRIRRSADPHDGGRWNDFVILKQGRMCGDRRRGRRRKRERSNRDTRSGCAGSGSGGCPGVEHTTR